MRSQTHILWLILLISLVMTSVSSDGQMVTATVQVGANPIAVVPNSATNKVYVSNYCGDDPSCVSSGTVTVVDGATNRTTTVEAGAYPFDIRVNSITNKIYNVNSCGTDLSCQSAGTVTVIDGATNNTTSVPVGFFPYQAAVNPVTNKIYVSNSGEDTVTVINGVNNQVSDITVGNGPAGLAVNPVTNKIYVPNYADNTVTVIDGTTQATRSINVGSHPIDISINSLTNKVYVANYGDHTVTVIDGSTNNTATVQVDLVPAAVAVNQVTNQIYVANSGTNTVTVIDGATLNTTSVTVGNMPGAVAIDPATNDIYVSNGGDNTVTMINGTNNNTTTLTVGTSPYGIAAAVVTNRVYVTNNGENTVSVIAGASAEAVQFFAVTPCRVLDTRPPGGSGPIMGGTSQSFVIPGAGNPPCGIPSGAMAFSLNVAVVPFGQLGYLTIWPKGEDQPLVATLNSDGRVKSNAAIVPAGYQGAISVYVTNTTNLILDINGYFAPANSHSLQYYPLPPCRVVDTRGGLNLPQGLGPPSFGNMETRPLPILSSACLHGVSNPEAYSFNVAVVPNPPGQPLNYLTLWPDVQGEHMPLAATLNNPNGTVVSNAAIVEAGTDGKINAFAYNSTDLIIDINGYFAAPGHGGSSFYPSAPCRVLDTRANNGRPFTGTLSPPVNVVGSPCAPPSTATGYVFNATVVPSNSLGYLTLWPDQSPPEPPPTVATLNAYDGAVTSNMAIVPNKDGSTDAFAGVGDNGPGYTWLVMDISGYFGP